MYKNKKKGLLVSKSSKKTRRFLKRMADRKGLDYRDAIVRFYGKKISEINKNKLISLDYRTPADRIL